jgi:release factor glutamine methyltransferase
VYVTDVSADALKVAALNAARHHVDNRVHPHLGNLLEPLPEKVHMIVANLPYISEPELSKLPLEISMFEPQLALAGGTDGLTQIRRLLSQAGSKLLSGGAVLLEIGYDQGSAVKDLARKYFPSAEVSVATDLSGLDRVVTISAHQ